MKIKNKIKTNWIEERLKIENDETLSKYEKEQRLSAINYMEKADLIDDLDQAKARMLNTLEASKDIGNMQKKSSASEVEEAAPKPPKPKMIDASIPRAFTLEELAANIDRWRENR